MTKRLISSLTLAAAAVLAACATTPPTNAMLEQARSAYSSAQNDPKTRELAPVELKAAGDALALANAAFARSDSTAQVDQLAYLARQRAALAREAGERKSAESAVAQSTADSDRMRLAARTNEADAAQARAATAQRSAEAAQRDAQASQRSAQSAQQQSEAAQRQAAAAQLQAGDAERRASAMEAQLRDLNARKTDRGMVVTIGDVLFDTGRAELKAGGMRNVEKLAVFLKDYPQRKALIEGFTDSVGSESSNQALSGRRAEAVRTAITGMGVASDRVTAQGYGEGFPVAGNDSAGGRQMNRRVEVVLSDESGALKAR